MCGRVRGRCHLFTTDPRGRRKSVRLSRGSREAAENLDCPLHQLVLTIRTRVWHQYPFQVTSHGKDDGRHAELAMTL